MQEYEFEGKTTEEAIQNASRELNVPVEDLEIDILEPGSAGIFGLVGGRKARIRVHCKIAEAIEAPKLEKEEQKDLDTALDTLRHLLGLIPVEATVVGEQADGKIILNIEGDRSGLLIGRKGKTLDALQYLMSKIINKTRDKKINVVVDAENYRRRREESLVQMAHKMGDKAKRIRKPVTTSPLNPQERRIIHLSLKEDERLETKSRGEGLLKRVVIIPKK